MSISIDRYVQISSGVSGAQSVAQRELLGLRFTSNPKVPVDTVITVGRGEADAYFGADSDEAAFANQYFSYVSPAPASQAQRLRFAAYPAEARAPKVFGIRTNSTISAFQAVTAGELVLTIGERTATLTGINLGEIATLADVASTLEQAIRAQGEADDQWGAATVVFDAVTGSFNLTGGLAAEAAVAVEQGQLAALLGWSQPAAILSPGCEEKTPVQAVQAAEGVTDSFGSFSFPQISVEEAVTVARYNAGLNMKYMFLVAVSKENAQQYVDALSSIASVGLVLNGKVGEFKESLPAAVMAATDYQRRNATVNYMYRQGPFSADVSSDSEADKLDDMRVNYYGETASAGQKLAFFQRGYLMGNASDALDMNVHANEQWLKSYLTAQLLSLQLSLGKIPANNEGRGLILAQVISAVDQARLNGTISIGKTLTTAQQIAISQLTGDPEAWHDVQTNGYWADVQIVERTGGSGATEYIAQYTLAYAKNDVVRKVEGSHNLI